MSCDSGAAKLVGVLLSFNDGGDYPLTLTLCQDYSLFWDNPDEFTKASQKVWHGVAFFLSFVT